MNNQTIIERQAVRALIITPAHEILLMRIIPPHGGDAFWIAPGGGLNDGETLETGLRRELSEELGISGFDIGPIVWLRQHTFNWSGKRLCQNERYVVVRHDRFDPVITDEVESAYVDHFRWVPIADLENFEERVAPITLYTIVTTYLEHGPPTKPLQVEVLVD